MTDTPKLSTQPILRGERVVLRPFRLDDAPVVEQLAGAREIADTTLSIPHPYPEGAGAAWISTHQEAWNEGRQVHYAVTSATDELFGAMSLGAIVRDQGWGEMGYWIGLPYWNHGYCTEAGRLMIGLAFSQLGLHRVQARHLTRNPSSGRVMEKIGMSKEGLHRHAVKKWGLFEDIASYAILAPAWDDRENL